MLTVLIIGLIAAIHIFVTGSIIIRWVDSDRYHYMTKVKRARYKLKCYFWELFIPYLLVRFAVEVVQDFYETVVTSLKKDKTEPKDI